MKLNTSLIYHIQGLDCKIENFAETLFRADGRINYAQYKVLVAVAEADKKTVGSVAKWIGISAPTASHLCRRLEISGLLEVQAATHDRRQKRLVVTNRAGRLLDDLTPQLEHAFAAKIGDFDAQDTEHMIKLARKLAEKFA